MFTLRVAPLSFGRDLLVRRASEYVHVANPRNLEKLTIGYRPKGWHLEKKGREFWHKLEVVRTGRHVTARVLHQSGLVPVSASTREWALRKFLYSPNDVSAYRNLGRVLGRRCLETGITEISSTLAPSSPASKLGVLLKEVEGSGVALQEPPPYIDPRPSDYERPHKPWDLNQEA